MSGSSDSSLALLLGLRLKGFGPTDAVAELAAMSESSAQSALEGLAASELAVYRDGRMSGWSLTAAGRTMGEELLASELDAAGARPVVHGCYERFLALNATMLQVCTDWQMSDPQTLNDHSDAAYDASVIDRLARIHDSVAPICGELTAAMGRFGTYEERLERALNNVAAGENDWFTSVRIASYHTVWFELHENLLATLRIDRATEASL